MVYCDVCEHDYTKIKRHLNTKIHKEKEQLKNKVEEKPKKEKKEKGTCHSYICLCGQFIRYRRSMTSHNKTKNHITKMNIIEDLTGFGIDDTILLMYEKKSEDDIIEVKYCDDVDDTLDIQVFINDNYYYHKVLVDNIGYYYEYI